MSEIVIYTTPNGHIKLDVNFSQGTLWLSQQQMADLFGTKRPAITKHLRNIFSSHELEEKAACSKMEHTAADGKRYQTKFYNLDAVISVGYRINSIQATHFRIWSTQVLKEHLIQGYTIYKPRLAQQGLHELQTTVELLKKTLVNHVLVNDIGTEAIQLILNYAKTWNLLLAYDEDELKLPAHTEPSLNHIEYEIFIQAVTSLKQELSSRGKATTLFGQERDHSLKSILNNIEQTFGGKPLYGSIAEKAAHLLYFIIKDHPFVDGNKRIGSFLFLIYLRLQNLPVKLGENGLVALALLVAESDPSYKDLMIRLIVNLLLD